jgi:NitT/TauT family transport system substrate-binding protein
VTIGQNRPHGPEDNKEGELSRKRWAFTALAFAVAGMLAATAGAMTRTTGTTNAAKLTKVTLQLKWVTQAQFAGYYAALQKGYYKQAGLDLRIKVGGPTITPETVVVGGGADIGLDWLPNLFATREKGGDIVSVAQMFARSGMTELTWKSSGINTIAKMKHKKVGVWCCGNQPELYAALTKNGIDPNNPSDVTVFTQPFDMVAFLSKQIDAAAAMTYNELAQVLETKNPATGKLYQLSDLNVFKMASPKVGTGMLEDNLFTTGKWLKSTANQQTLVKFLAASFRGWVYCRDHQAACLNIVLKNGPTLGKGHQAWQLNEINALIWPSPSGIGVVPAAAVAQTAKIAQTYGVITKAPSGATNYTYARRALAQVKATGTDVYGKKWKKAKIAVTAGGK